MDADTTPPRRIRITRDLVLFTFGLAITVHQTLFTSVDRPYLLAVGAAMMGLPVYMATIPRRAVEKQ